MNWKYCFKEAYIVRGASQVVLAVKKKKKKKIHSPANAGRYKRLQVQFLDREDPLEKGIATHFSILAWRIPWTEEAYKLWSTGSHRVGHDWSDWAHTHAYSEKASQVAHNKESTCQCRRSKRHGFDPQFGKIPWSRKWQPALVFCNGKIHGQRSLEGYNPWGHKKLDTIEQLSTDTQGVRRQ